jgi:molybdenum cofactor biosynthesis protein B
MSSTNTPKPVRFAILTVSDTRTEETDTSGATLIERILAAGHLVTQRRIVVDREAEVDGALDLWLDSEDVDAIISTGGTGLTGRDITTDVFEARYDKAIPGFGELFRWLSFRDIGTSTIQSRATAGIAQQTLLFALPGSPGACRLAWDEILLHQFDETHRPCNFIGIMARLDE